MTRAAHRAQQQLGQSLLLEICKASLPVLLLPRRERHLDGARSALLVTRWICCEDGLKRSKGNMHIEQVSAYFCPPSRGGSPCAALPAGGQARKQKKYEEQEEDNADNENHGGHNVDC